MADEPDSSWSLLLDEMEADLHQDIERIHPWTAPDRADPIPPHLLDRARRIVEAQQTAIAVLADEQSSVARHLGALRTVPTPYSGSVYLDVVG